MAETNTPGLPEGTDKVIAGAAAQTADTTVGGTGGGSDDVMIADTALAGERETAAARGGARGVSAGANSDNKLIERLRSGGERLSGQAGEKARGLVAQGLERSAEALANVSKLVGDTAAGLDDRLGPDYGEYARRAAAAIENTANTIASKDPDELIDDTRNFVRNSPGIAIAGAAIAGFVLARFLKTGLARDERDEDDEDDDD